MLPHEEVLNRLDKMEAEVAGVRKGINQMIELLSLILEVENAQLTAARPSDTLLEK